MNRDSKHDFYVAPFMKDSLTLADIFRTFQDPRANSNESFMTF